MPSLRTPWLALVLVLHGGIASAASLPTGLSPEDIASLVRIVGFPSATRLMRSAEALPGWPGWKLGIEVAMSGAKDVADFGDRNGSVPQLLVLPRFYLSKGLSSNVELTLSTFPNNNPPGISTAGGALKWTYYREREGIASAAAYFGYTRVWAFHQDYVGNDVEMGTVVSKDFVRLRPYLGAAVLLAQGAVRPALARTPTQGSLQAALHSFIGLEWELPVALGAQLDLMNLTPMASFFLGKQF